MSDSESGEEQSGLLDEKEFDVTNTINKIMCCCMLKQTLLLEQEEAVLNTTTCISNASKRMPYGELGSVEHATVCGCCHSFTSNLNPENEGKKQPIAPGCGCDEEVVEEIVNQLKARMKGRGDTGNIRRAEESLKVTKALAAKVDAILRHMKIPEPQVVLEEPKTVFEHKEYDVTGCCHRVVCCGSQIMNLDPEEVLVKTTTICSSSNNRGPYGELGSVDESKCCCFSALSSGMGNYCPGTGCSHELVAEVAQELKIRMKARGDTGNIQRQEETLVIVKRQEAKINAIMKQMGVPMPQTPEVPGQMTMG